MSKCIINTAYLDKTLITDDGIHCLFALTMSGKLLKTKTNMSFKLSIEALSVCTAVENEHGLGAIQ